MGMAICWFSRDGEFEVAVSDLGSLSIISSSSVGSGFSEREEDTLWLFGEGECDCSITAFSDSWERVERELSSDGVVEREGV